MAIGCPCRAVVQCRNGGYCVDAATPFCQCTHGWSGPTCEDIVYVAPVLGKLYCGVFTVNPKVVWLSMLLP